MSKLFFAGAFAVGLAVLAWIGLGFAHASWLPLVVTLAIAGAYLAGAFELTQFRRHTAALARALQALSQAPTALDAWLATVPPALRDTVRERVENGRGTLPGPALTPYLVGLLVMLGMLGTFFGMVATFQGAVFALEGSTDLQAIRGALAAPIKGLGLSFGTSVAGVATSAMLGLMSAISRRDRLLAARALEAHLAGPLQPFSLARRRQDTFAALQAQAGTLPQVVDALQALLQRMEQRGADVDRQLLERQAQFQRETAAAYASLAERVGSALQQSLAGAAQAAGDTLRPVVQDALGQVVRESRALHERVGDAAQRQADALSTQFAATARGVSETWNAALAAHARQSEALTQDLRQTLDGFGAGFEARGAALLTTLQEQATLGQQALAAAEAQRVQAFSERLQALAGELAQEWRRASAEGAAAQQAAGTALARSAEAIGERTGAQAAATLRQMEALLQRSEQLVEARIAGEARWTAEHGERLQQLAATVRGELAVLRDDEARRGEAAVARLDTLQAAVAGHLATLGAALEAPITRLLHTASEVPQAAAAVITQLQQEMGRLAERDDAALQERAVLLERLGALLAAVTQASGEQRAAVQSLVDAASSVLAQAGARFDAALQTQSVRSADAAAQVAGSAVEMAALAEAFGHSVQSFQAGNDRLVETLQRVEASLQRSTARSDEQLAYYVAQAREVIDLSIASQQGLVDNLRQLQGKTIAPIVTSDGARA